MRLVKRAFLATITLVIATAGSLHAQNLAGRWKGRMEPTNLSAELELALRRLGATWQAELSFRAGPASESLPIEELRIAGDSATVRTKIEGADVSLELISADDLMLGSVRVTENGRLLAEGPVALARATDTAGQLRATRWLDERGSSIDAPHRDTIIEAALKLFQANYVFGDLAERAVADVRARVKQGEYNTIHSPARLAELLGRHLSEATLDRHVQVKFGAERATPALADTDVETPRELARLRREAEAGKFGIGQVRVLRGNVGYLPFTRFFRAEFAGDALAAAMRRLAGSDALIVDLRESGGGDPVMVVLASSWFFDGRPRHWNDIVRRFDSTTRQFWTAAWLPGPRYVGKPVYVLTAHRTFSAPESFAFELQKTRRATIVGEVTGGGAHSGAWFPLDKRFSLFIPLSRYVSGVSGGDWEGTGVIPDIACSAARALECAHLQALRTLGRKQK